MSQPPAYNRQENFTEYAAAHTAAPYNPSDHDAEFDAVEQTLDAVLTNLAMIQRDDGALKNESVHPDSLSAATLLLIASDFVPRGLWVTATAYAVGDMVQNGSSSYVCATAHTSGTFATDLAAGKWVLGGSTVVTVASGISVTPTGSIAATNVQAALAELDTEKAAAGGSASQGFQVQAADDPNEAPRLSQVQNNSLWFAAAGGTVDAITATIATAGITALVDGFEVCVRASGANTSATPTFELTLGATSTTPLTIINGITGGALVAGEIYGSAHEMRLRYKASGTKWALMNPYVPSVSSRTNAATITLTSAAPNATLLATSARIQKIVTSGTVPLYPSITLPDMSGIVAAPQYFTFVNTTPYVVAVKSSSGTIRDHIPPYETSYINVIDTSTAAGNWYMNNPPCLVGEDVFGAVAVTCPSLVNAGYTFQSKAFVRLSATQFAWVWAEVNTNLYIYAKLYTIDEAARTVTAGNQVTLLSGGEGINNGAAFNWDSDFNGNAYLVWNRNGATNTYIDACALSVSGGTLSASGLSSVSQPYAGQQSYTYCWYLGSNGAFAYGGSLFDGTSTYYTYVRACKITAPATVTQSSSNTSYAMTSGVGQAARTSLLSAAIGSNPCKYVLYDPTVSPITFTLGNRASTTLALDIEIATTDIYDANYGSFAQRGFMYAGTSKVAFGQSVYDITNAGTANVTAAVSSGVNAKAASHSSYLSLGGYSLLPNRRCGLFTGAAAIYYASYTGMFGSQWGVADTSGSTLDLSVSGVLADSGGTPETPNVTSTQVVSAVPLMPRGISYFGGMVMSSTLALLLYLNGGPNSTGRYNLNVVFAKIGTSLN